MGIYIVTGPRTWRVGALETVVVQAFGQKENFPVKLSIVSYPDKKTSYASQSLQLTSANNYQGIVKLMIDPKDLPRKGDSDQYVYLEARSNAFTKEEKVPVTYKNGFLFIQTDKPFYTPDQSVKIRVYSMDEELKPGRRNVILTFEDPEKVKVDIMAQSDLTGIISFPDFKIPANPKYGIWTIQAAYENHFTTSSVTKFEVKEYVLPRFFVSIEPEKNFICYDTFEDFSVKVKANYYYNKVVERGKVYLRYGIIQNGERKMMPKSIQVQQVINGEADFQFNSKKAVEELGYSELEDLVDSYLYITASVEESEDGRTEESENADVKYVLTPYTLKLIGTPLFVKPTLPYHIKVQVKDTLDKPVGNIPLRLTGEMISEDGVGEELKDNPSMRRRTDKNDGTAVFVLNFPSNVASLDFQITTEDPSLPEDNQAKAEYTAKSYNSLTKSYLYINWVGETKTLRVGDYLNVQLSPSSPYLAKLQHYSYLVISKGKILEFGTENRVHQSTTQNLNIEITPDMVPSIRLLVYYIITGDTTAELVADSVWVDIVEDCVNNQKVKLSTTTHKEELKPGRNMALTLAAQTNSLVALSAVDVAIYSVGKKSSKPLERVLRKIEESDLGCGAGAGLNNADVFRLAGLTFITNANIRASQDYSTKCNELVRPKRSLDFNGEVDKKAQKYRDKTLRACCMDGVTCFKDENNCTGGVKRLKSKNKGPICIKVFEECCLFAKTIKDKIDEAVHDVGMGRMYIRTVFDIDEPQIRSYFPESWLWEEHFITDRRGVKTVSVTLPDSLTTWELQGISMSDKGLCVAEPLKVTVFKDFFLDVQLPYSVIRGEQIQIKVVVYNYKNANIKGCVTVEVGKEICLFSDDSSQGAGKPYRCTMRTLTTSSLSTFTFNILPLELGIHDVVFTLSAQTHSEKVVKPLRVVPEGIKKEIYAGVTLDPQGIQGITKRRHELNYKIPQNIVPKSKVTRILSINGNVLGEVINAVLNSEKISYLISLPKGSAETELMRIVPIFYVYHYLETKKEWSLVGPSFIASQITMKKQMREGVSSLLLFRNRDFSYSVWRDSEPSTWLTAFAMRIFGEVEQYVSVDQMSVCNSLLWLTRECQSRDGSFKDNSNYQPLKLQGNLPRESKEKTLYLTAFVLIGMQKSFHICPVAQLEDPMNRAIEYLANNIQNAQSTFTLAITAYAFALSNVQHPKLQYAATVLKREAYSKGVGDVPLYLYWKDNLKKFDPTVPSADTARMVETTAYALMAFLKLGQKNYANPAIRWLQEQQRYGGGFYSTQDTVIALEALTEVAMMEKKLTLNMPVHVSYRKSGDFKRYELSEKSSFTRPDEVPLPEDLIISTGGASGIATAKVQTVYHVISPRNENCNFDIKIEPKLDWEGEESIFDEDTSQAMHLEACAKYKAPANEVATSGNAVMEITMVSGLEIDENYLDKLTRRVDQYVTDYKIEDGQVFLYFDWIPSDEDICVVLLVRKVFKVAVLSPGIFKVYDLHAPEQQCTIFFNPYITDKLEKLCSGEQCKCIEAKCPKLQAKLDTSITADDRKQAACKAGITYAYKVVVISSEEDGDFVKYTATLLDIIKKGKNPVKAKKDVKFIKKKTCKEDVINQGDQFLIMGKEGIQIRTGFEFQYEYPLDSSTWVELWPPACYTDKCDRFLDILNDFSESFLYEGC
ncbi:complement C5 [Rhinophrynus dorsalis]